MGRHVLWLACLWLCCCGRARPARAASAPPAAAPPALGGTLHSAAATLLNLAAPELRRRGDPLDLWSIDSLEDSKPLALTSSSAPPAIPRSSYKYTHTTVGYAAYVIAYLFYTVSCVWYELRALKIAERRSEAANESAKLAVHAGAGQGGAAAGPQARPVAPKQRFVEWDFIKAVMLYFVIFLHTGRNGWKKGGLSDNEQTFFLILASFPMPTFAFVSGVFGASMERMAMKKTLCYTIGTFLLSKLLGGMIIMVTPGPSSFENPRMTGVLVFWYVGALVFWYLKALGVWRFILTPLFHFARKRMVPDVATFAVVYVSCYLLRHLGLPYWTHEWIFFAPYYAQGLLLSPLRWSELLSDRRCTFAALAFIVVWCVSLLVPAVRDWNDVACTHGFLQCPNSHWPASLRFDRRMISTSMFLDDFRIYALQDGLSMAVVWLVAACTKQLQAVAPRLVSVVCGCGTRTLYGYVLHFMFFLLLGVRMGVMFPNMEDWKWVLLCFVLSLQALFVFCSSLTEHLFSWVIMPFWILRFFEKQPRACD